MLEKWYENKDIIVNITVTVTFTEWQVKEQNLPRSTEARQRQLQLVDSVALRDPASVSSCIVN